MDSLKKLEEYEKRFGIVKATVGKMPVATMTGSLLLGGYLVCITKIILAERLSGAFLVTGVFVPLFLLIYYDVRKTGIRARARDRPRESRSSAGSSG